MNVIERFDRILSFGFYDRLNRPVLKQVLPNTVAAGNPEKYSYVSAIDSAFPLEFVFKNVAYHTKDYSSFVVSGDSMSPDGIFNGDSLLVKPSIMGTDVSISDYIVIKVDHDFYKTRHQDYEELYQFKLREGLFPILREMTEEEVCSQIAVRYEEFALPEYKGRVIENLREARAFYGKEPLFASVTFPDGKMHISFHAQSLILGVVVVIGRRINGHLEYIDPKDLQRV